MRMTAVILPIRHSDTTGHMLAIEAECAEGGYIVTHVEETAMPSAHPSDLLIDNMVARALRKARARLRAAQARQGRLVG